MLSLGCSVLIKHSLHFVTDALPLLCVLSGPHVIQGSPGSAAAIATAVAASADAAADTVIAAEMTHCIVASPSAGLEKPLHHQLLPKGIQF